MSQMTIEDKRIWIEEKLDSIFNNTNKSDLLALDFEINLLICAAQSYKHETVLKPFPSTFLSDSNNNKNYTQLLNAIESLPPLLEWKNRIKNKKFTSDQLLLIYWILIHKNYQLFYSTTMNQEKLKDVAKFTENFLPPTHVFEVNYSEEKNKKFELLKQQLIDSQDSNTITPTTSLSFHGTSMCNIYSILHSGLLGHFSKNALFGEGTYLSQEPSISLHYSPSNKTWSHSLIGQRMSCMLVCETINDFNHVKSGIKDSKSSSSSSSKNIPEKYFIVKNNDYVRVKYVMVYAEKTKHQKRNNKLAQFINENKFILILLAYSLLLMFIGLMNSRAFHKYYRVLSIKLSSFLLGEATSYE